MRPQIRWSQASSVPATAGGRTVVVHSRVLSLSLGPAGFVWQTPTSISVGASQHRIVDVTRMVQVALLLLAALVTSRSRA